MHASKVHLRILLENYRNIQTRTVRLTQVSLYYYCSAQLKGGRDWHGFQTRARHRIYSTIHYSALCYSAQRWVYTIRCEMRWHPGTRRQSPIVAHPVCATKQFGEEYISATQTAVRADHRDSWRNYGCAVHRIRIRQWRMQEAAHPRNDVLLHSDHCSRTTTNREGLVWRQVEMACHGCCNVSRRWLGQRLQCPHQIGVWGCHQTSRPAGDVCPQVHVESQVFAAVLRWFARIRARSLRKNERRVCECTPSTSIRTSACRPQHRPLRSRQRRPHHPHRSKHPAPAMVTEQAAQPQPT